MESTPAIRRLGIDLYNEVVVDIANDEGVVFEIYEDHLGNKTVGIGHLITKDDPEYGLPTGTPVSEQRVMELYEQDLDTAVDDVFTLFPMVREYPNRVKRVLINMAFNLGLKRLAGFKRMIGHVKRCNWFEAADEMLRSKWATQVPNRANALAKMMRGDE